MDPSRVPEYVMNTLCRVCAEKSSKLNPIFQYETLSLKINKCLSIQVNESDHLPLNICESCYVKIDNSYSLYVAAHEADEKLKKLWKILLKETMTNYPELMTERQRNSKNNFFLLEKPPTQEKNINEIPSNIIITVPEKIFHSNELENLRKEVVLIEKTISIQNYPSYIDVCNKNEQNETNLVEIEEIPFKESLQEVEEKVEPDSTCKSSKKIYQCQFCSCQLSTLSSLSIHESTHSKEKPYLCDICGKSFKHVNNLRCHNKIHLTVRKKHVCKICNKPFLTSFFLKEHMNLHTGETPYKCPTCNKEFRGKVHLRQHKWTHSKQKFTCSICGNKFNRKGNMTEHIKKFHSESAEKDQPKKEVKQIDTNGFKCSLCSLVFSNQILLKNHFKLHADQKMFFCGICGKKFRHSGSLTYHRRAAHTGEKPFKCSYCEEKFSLRSVQIIHERKNHTFEHPYKCSFCSRVFTNSSSLRNHSFIHSKEKLFECDECGKKFSRSSNLLIHKKLHLGDRQFSCEQCDKKYIQKHDLLKHKKVHDPKSKPFFCKYCGNSFSRKKDSSKHTLCQFEFFKKTNSGMSNAEQILDSVTTNLEENALDLFEEEEQLILESVEELAEKTSRGDENYQETNSMNLKS